MTNFTLNFLPLRKFIKISGRVLLGLIFLIMLLYGLLHLPRVQTWLVQKAATSLSNQLGTEVSIRHVDLHFFDKLALQGLLVRDKKNDTLLYAGSLSVKITDWFFLKDKFTLHYIGLEDGFINLSRTDSIWNYRFIADYFTDTSKAKGKSPDINLQHAELKRFRLFQKDGWVGQDLVLTAEALDLSINAFDLNRKHLDISAIRLASPSFTQFEYPGRKPKGLNKTKAPEEPAGPYQWNTDDWKVTAELVQLIDGHLRIDKETDHLPYTDRFDGEHLEFSKLAGNLSKVRLTGDTLFAAMALSGKEKSGLEVKKLNADVRFNPAIMEFNNLDLETNKSRLRNYYAMHYRSFLNDMNDFVDKVVLEGNFENSAISSDDIAIFAPELKDWKRNFELSGKAMGTIESMRGSNLLVRSGNTLLDGDVELLHMTDLDSFQVNLKARSLSTDYADISGFAPSLKNLKEIKGNRLGRIRFTGDLSGSMRSISGQGSLSSSLGAIRGNIRMNFPEKAVPFYEAQLATGGFDLGRLLDNNMLGSMEFSGKIRGSGFTLEKLNADVDAEIKKIHAAGYDYKNFLVKGHFDKNLFTGKMGIDDPNLVIPEMTGSIRLSGKELETDLEADIRHADFKAIRLTDRDLSLSGRFDLKFTGNNIDNFLGSARMHGVRLKSFQNVLEMDSLVLLSREKDGIKYLSLTSEPVNAEISGKFTILELPLAFRHFLSRYYPSYISAPDATLSDQEFQFNVKTSDCSSLVNIFLPEASGLDYSNLSGKIDLSKNEFQIHGLVPSFSYQKNDFSGIQFNGTGNEDSLSMQVAVDDIAISDSLHFPKTNLNFSSRNDISEIHLRTSASETLSEAELNARMQTFGDGVDLHFYPSSFIINNKKWQLEKDGELNIRSGNIAAKDIKFNENYQEIRLNTDKDPATGAQVLSADLKSVNIEDFTPLFLTQPEVRGLLTGKALISQPLDKATVKFTGRADSFSLDKSRIGTVELGTDANLTTGNIHFSAKSDNPAYRFDISGDYNTKDSVGQYLDARLIGNRIDLKVLQPYLSSVFSNVEGIATADLRMTGEGKDSYLTGMVNVDSGALDVGFTRCRYLLRNQKIRFNKDEIEVRNVELRDSFANRGLLNGILRHRMFSNFSFDNVRLETPRMLLLNTTEADNQDFYGNLIGSAVMTLNGPLREMKMTIDGSPSLSDSSHIYLPTGSSRESNAVDYIDFVELGSLSAVNSWTSDVANIILDMNIDANPACKVDVILDKATGDIIKGTGKGLISLRVGNREPLSVRGRYELTSGLYTFNFQTFFKRPFILKRGNILWNGDPYEAIIDIDAEYTARNVNISSILPTEGFRQREDIIILSHLKGNLSKPMITFEFRLTEKSELNRDYIAVKKLAEMQNDENEMNKQVASLLLFNTFINENQNFLSGQNTMSFTASTIGGFISNWLTNMFNKQLERATNGMLSTYIDINPTLSLQKNANELQANVRAGLKLLLSNRLIFLVGGNLDYNNPYFQLEQKGLLTPDITLEWLLNKEGSVRVVGFHRSSIDNSMGQRNRSGAQLSYRKDFDRLSDIFKSRKRIEEEAVKSELLSE